ncbi:MAG: TonB-dependent receptor [Acidobacteriota bacterium]
MRTLTLALVVSLLGTAVALGAELKGTVTDREGTPVADARLSAGGVDARTGQDGRFTIQLDRDRVTIEVSADGYYADTIETRVPADVVVRLTAIIPMRESVLVSSERAVDGTTPRSHSDLTAEEIEKSYWAQDVPILLARTSNLYAYSDNGNGIGYSYLKVRGFDQKRVSVLIDGIPHNDPESGEVFWIDYPDLPANTESVQIQRGVGTALYGGSNLGGFINLETAQPRMDRRFSFSAGAGTYDSSRYSLAFHSGLLGSKYAIYGRLSRIHSDGYRDLSWTDTWSYFVSMERYDEKMVNRLRVYGGPEETHLAYDGVTRDYLEGKITGDARNDRKYNPLSYPGEIDHFNQPHVEWLSDIQLSNSLTLSNAAYYIKGSGYYEQFRTNRRYWQYNLEPFYLPDGTYVDRTDMVRQRRTDQGQLGLISRLSWERGRDTFMFGGDVQYHHDRHYAYVMWGAILPPGTLPEHPYYDYKVRKWSGSVYVRDTHRFTDKVTGVAELQVKSSRIQMLDDRFKQVDFKTSFPIVSPRIGVTYNPVPRQRLFVNFAMSGREPAFKDIYDPQDPYSVPLFAQSNPYRDPLVDPERLYDYELGWSYSRDRLSIELTAFHMDFRNEVIYGGQLDDNGSPITGNARRSYHQGIELAVDARLPLSFYARANAALNRNILQEYTEYTWDGPEIRDGNVMGGFPKQIANVMVGYDSGSWAAEVRLFYAGEQFIDQSENERRNPERRDAPGYIDKVIDPYTSLNLSVHYRLPVDGIDARLSLQINNVFDTLYESAGYVEDGTPYWIPAATRNAFLTLDVNF